MVLLCILGCSVRHICFSDPQNHKILSLLLYCLHASQAFGWVQKSMLENAFYVILNAFAWHLLIHDVNAGRELLTWSREPAFYCK